MTTFTHLSLAAPLLLATTPATATHPGAGTRPGVTATSTPKKAVEVRFGRGMDVIGGVVRVWGRRARPAAPSLTPDRPLGRNPPDPIV